MIWSWMSLVVLLFLSGFFSGMETALTAVTRLKVEHCLKKNKPGAKILKYLKDDMSETIITILIGNNVVNIGAAVIATLLFTDLFGNAGAGIATGVMTFLTLTFGEITPKGYCLNHATTVSLRFGFLIHYMKIILIPFVLFFAMISRLVNKIFGVESPKNLFTEDEFKTMITVGESQKVLEPYESRIIEEVLEFNDLKVDGVMIPEKNVFMLDENLKLLVVIDRIIKEGFSRVPIYEEKRQNVTGFIHVKDILAQIGKNLNELRLRDLSIQPVRIQHDAIIDDVFKEMNKRRRHIAFVYKKDHFIGVVTLEDIMEEIFGAINDEGDAEKQR